MKVKTEGLWRKTHFDVVLPPKNRRLGNKTTRKLKNVMQSRRGELGDRAAGMFC